MTKIRRKFNWKVFCVVIACIFAVYLTIAMLPRTKCYEGENPFVIKENEKPLLIAHGGGNREFPDNTLEACYNAYSADPDVMLEMDVSVTKDGRIIMSHDTTLDKRTNVSGAIADWTYDDLLNQKVDFGYLNKKDENGKVTEMIKFTNDDKVEVTPLDVVYPEGVTARDDKIFKVTLLTEVLESFPRNTVNVEIKQDGGTGLKALNAVIKILEEHNAFDRVVLASFHSEIYKELKHIKKTAHPDLMCSPEYVGVGTLLISGALALDAFYAEPVAVLQIPMSMSVIRLDKKWFVNVAHKHNIAVHYWTIDNEEDMKYLIEIGADGIMTNYPHRLQKVYKEVFGESK